MCVCDLLRVCVCVWLQDTLLGSQKITKKDVFIEKDLMMNMIMCLKKWDGKIKQPAIMIPTKGKPGV